MKTKTSLLTIISVVVVTAAAFIASNAEKLDTNSAGSLAVETFPLFNQNAPATATSSPLSGGTKTPEALFPLSNAKADATTAAAFLPWLLLPRFKRRLAQHHTRKRDSHSLNNRHFLQQIIVGIGLDQSCRGVFARRFQGAIAVFLSTCLRSFASYQSTQR